MPMVENLTRTTLEQIEKVLTTRTVVGEPLTIEGKTLIPLISVGFGFGAGGGSAKGEAKQKGEGEGGGTGGGAWVRPVAVIVIDKESVKIEPVRGFLGTAIDSMFETIPKVIDKFKEKQEERKQEERKQEE